MDIKEFTYKVTPLRDNMLRYAIRMTQNREDAEDIVQESLLRLWSVRDKISEYRSIEALSIHITHNLVVDKFRSIKPVDGEDKLKFCQAATPLPDEITEQRESADNIKKLIGSLPTLQQAIIRMKDVEGYELSEIAGIMGIQIEAVRMNLSRARKKIREQFLALQKSATQH